MDRSTSVLVVTVLCVLAGCNGFGGQGDVAVEETMTPAPAPTVATEQTQGISEHRINASAVTANHRAVLGNESYTTRTRIRWQNENGSTFATTTIHRVESGGQRFHVTAEYGRPLGEGNWTRHELWYDGNGSLLSVRHGNGDEEYQRFDSEPVVQYPRARVIDGLFARLEPRDVTQTSNGKTVVKGPIEGVDELRDLPQFRDQNNATMAARIAPAGYVERVAIGFDATIQGRAVHVRVTIDFMDVGATTVSEPDWTRNVTVESATPTPFE